jgi:glyoxylase-like metal-dependent hydrolase (beta-lactamase superfamily II)
MEFKQVYTPGLAHCSYVIGGKNECVVVDPSRSVDRYVQIAENFNLPITAIIETHLHADFISGHMELAKRTGAQIYISAQAKANFAHYAVKDGEEFRIDTLLFKCSIPRVIPRKHPSLSFPTWKGGKYRPWFSAGIPF